MVYLLRCRAIAFCYLRQAFIHVCFHLCAALVRVVNQRFQRGATIYKSWHWAVIGCTNNQRKCKLLMSEICAAHEWKRSMCMHGVYRLHRFPSVPEKCWEWEIALNRKNFKPSKLASASVDPLVTVNKQLISPVPLMPSCSFVYHRSVPLALLMVNVPP